MRTNKDDIREYLVHAGLEYIGHAPTRAEAYHIACQHNRRGGTWAHVTEVRK